MTNPTLDIVWQDTDCQPIAVGVSYRPPDGSSPFRAGVRTPSTNLVTACRIGLPDALRKLADMIEAEPFAPAPIDIG